MIDTDANEYYLNEYLDKQQKQEEAFENLLSDHNVTIGYIEKLIDALKEDAKDYYGYDFTEDVEELIKDML